MQTSQSGNGGFLLTYQLQSTKMLNKRDYLSRKNNSTAKVDVFQIKDKENGGIGKHKGREAYPQTNGSR